MVDLSKLKTTAKPGHVVQPLGMNPVHGPIRSKHIVLVLGVGPGLRRSLARTFAEQGYTIAIMSRSKARLDSWAKEFDQIIRTKWEQDGERVPLTSSPLARAFACDVQDIESIKIAFRDIQATWPDKLIGTCLYNASIRKRGPFLDIPVSKLKDSVEANIIAPYVFAQESLRAMNKHRQGGTIIFTGATSSVRGAAGFAPFAASKGGLRNMCQSLAREYGEQNVHIAHVIVDGLIESKTALSYFGLPTTERFQDGLALVPDEMAKSWLFLAQQHPSTWTFEMDLRPAKEHF